MIFYHEITKGRNHETHNNNFVVLNFRAFVIILFVFRLKSVYKHDVDSKSDNYIVEEYRNIKQGKIK